MGPQEDEPIQYIVPSSELFDGGPDQRVIGLLVEGQAVAIPHAVGWWHEIINLNIREMI